MSLLAFKILSLLLDFQHERDEKKSERWIGRDASVTSDPKISQSYRLREALRDSHHIPGSPRVVATRTLGLSQGGSCVFSLKSKIIILGYIEEDEKKEGVGEERHHLQPIILIRLGP